MNDRMQLLNIKRAAMKQTEIELNDAITTGYKQMLVNVLCERFETAPIKYLTIMNKHAKAIINPKIPHNLKFFKHKYPQAFVKCAGFPFIFEDDGINKVVVLSPDVAMYFSTEEMMNIMTKAQSGNEKDQKRYERIAETAKKYLEAKSRLRERQIHYVTLLNQPKYNTYKDMLRANPEFFEKIYNAITGFDLLTKYKV